MFQQFVIGLLIHEAVAYLAQISPADWAQFKDTAMTKVKAFVHPAWLASELGSVVYKACDALAEICADADQNQTILKALAAKDWGGAEAAALSELVKVVPEVAKLFAPVMHVAAPAAGGEAA